MMTVPTGSASSSAMVVMVRVMSGPFRWASDLRAVRSVRGLDIGRTRSFRVLSGEPVFDGEGVFFGAICAVVSGPPDDVCELVGVDRFVHGAGFFGASE